MLHPQPILMQRNLISIRIQRLGQTMLLGMRRLGHVQIRLVLHDNVQLRLARDAAKGLLVVAIVRAVALGDGAQLEGLEVGVVERVVRVALLRFVLRARVCGRVLVVHVCFCAAACELDDERGHGHFDVELDHVGYRVKLDVDDWVGEEHEADEEALELVLVVFLCRVEDGSGNIRP